MKINKVCKRNLSRKDLDFGRKRVSRVVFGIENGTLFLLLSLPILFFVSEAYAFDLDAAVKAMIDPPKKIIKEYCPAGIFIMGAIGAMKHQQGDLRDIIFGFGKGILTGGLVVAVVIAGLSA